MLEKVQRAVTKHIGGMKGLNYEQRLEKLGWTTLEEEEARRPHPHVPVPAQERRGQLEHVALDSAAKRDQWPSWQYQSHQRSAPLPARQVQLQGARALPHHASGSFPPRPTSWHHQQTVRQHLQERLRPAQKPLKLI